MKSRTRFIVACLATLAVLLPLGWLWQRSLMPDTYSVADMGTADYGRDAKGKPHRPPSAGTHEHGATKGAKDKGISIATLVEPSKKAADVIVDLSTQQGTVPIAGHDIEGYVLNGRTPGPEIVAKEGELVEVRLRNDNVAEGVALHWHGIDVPNAEDGVAGVTQNAVLPGKSHTYRFVAKQPGTYWYHSHQVAHEQVAGGLFGSLVVQPKAGIKARHDLTAVAHTYAGNRTLNGRAGDVHAVARPGDTVRLRIINTDDGTLSTWSSVPYRVAAIDGYDLQGETAVRGKRLEVPAGGRADLEFTVPRTGAARVQVGAATAYIIGPRQSYPERPAQPTKALDLLSYGKGSADMPKANRVFDYSIGRRPGFIDGRPGYWWTINGRMWPDVPMFMVRRGDVVKFRIENHSGEVHPMHLHGHHALVTARNGKPAKGGPLWVDTIDIRDDETIDLVFRADNPGIWMDHCHQLPHAVEGLVAHLMYEGYTTPYKVGGKTDNQPE
ncbi:MAG TPA: multicopper oxidase family protein [Aeromicrobium sp.]|nr:multicopper oxidase family protein [Aeromicrobium sp.]